jgi:hypothetical protein
MKNELSMLYKKIYDKKINSLNDIYNKNENRNLSVTIEKDITDIYAEGKINDQHYKLLKEKLSKIWKFHE